MKTIRDFLSENFQFLEVKFSIYLNRYVFVMKSPEEARQILEWLQSIVKNICLIILFNKHEATKIKPIYFHDYEGWSLLI